MVINRINILELLAKFLRSLAGIYRMDQPSEENQKYRASSTKNSGGIILMYVDGDCWGCDDILLNDVGFLQADEGETLCMRLRSMR
ncbi:hypothetical protein RRG08_032904 [Elysia crispata]|uniref:Uncharacterized protein n=1 Tax=Elysia crispata TaxID=231223 RepID=A0AAE1A6Z1_9GAST|nr:hypothetical protein RRG08_032904 [Elysia crispata]